MIRPDVQPACSLVDASYDLGESQGSGARKRVRRDDCEDCATTYHMRTTGRGIHLGRTLSHNHLAWLAALWVLLLLLLHLHGVALGVHGMVGIRRTRKHAHGRGIVWRDTHRLLLWTRLRWRLHEGPAAEAHHRRLGHAWLAKHIWSQVDVHERKKRHRGWCSALGTLTVAPWTGPTAVTTRIYGCNGGEQKSWSASSKREGDTKTDVKKLESLVIGTQSLEMGPSDLGTVRDNDGEQYVLNHNVDNDDNSGKMQETRLLSGQRSLFNEVFPRGTVLRDLNRLHSFSVTLTCSVLVLFLFLLFRSVYSEI